MTISFGISLVSAEETQSIQIPDCHPARCVYVCVVEVAGRGGGEGGGVIPFQSVVKLAEGSRGWKHTIIGASRAAGDWRGKGNILKKDSNR